MAVLKIKVALIKFTKG